jgi:hypothetical protein
MSQVTRATCYFGIFVVVSTCGVSTAMPASAENRLLAEAQVSNNFIGLSSGYPGFFVRCGPAIGRPDTASRIAGVTASEGRSVALSEDGSGQLGHVPLRQVAPGLSVFDLEISTWLGLARLEQVGQFDYFCPTDEEFWLSSHVLPSD